MNIVVKEGYELKMFLAPRKGNYYYAIIDRHCSCEPFVFCSGYDITDGTWCAGHYFYTYREALEYAIKYCGLA